MFVFNSCSNDNLGNYSISFPDHSFLQFPSPFDDDGNPTNSLLLQQQQSQHDIFLHHHIPLNEPSPPPPSSTFVNALRSSETINNDVFHQGLISQRKKSSSKRDRHSKINTLHGPRDRRMRLSLPVAKEFFGLQDMLGVDKASKTVEWLLFQARHAIKKLSKDQQSFHIDGDGDTRSPSSVSDGEVVSGIIDETSTVVNNNDINTKELEGRKATKKEKRSRVGRKMAFHPLTRECREKARARARARTREKQLQIEGTSTTTKLQDVSKIRSSWMSSTQMENNGNEEQLRTRNEGRIITDHETTDDCLMIMGRWSPSNSIYCNSLHNNNNGSPGQEHSYGDFQFLGKSWEPYNNHSIR